LTRISRGRPSARTTSINITVPSIFFSFASLAYFGSADLTRRGALAQSESFFSPQALGAGPEPSGPDEGAWESVAESAGREAELGVVEELSCEKPAEVSTGMPINIAMAKKCIGY